MADQFPDDWKAQIAGDSEDNLKSLEGFDSPAALGTAYFEQSAAAKAAEGANWRDPFVGDDKKRGTQLERYTTQEDFGKAFFERDALISAGDLLKPLPENATDDDIKAYRAQQGAPEEVAGYFDGMPDGLVIGEDDRPIVEDFLAKVIHKFHLPPAAGYAAMTWYNDFQEQQEAAIAEQDIKHSDEFDATLRDEWGPAEFRTNMNYSENLMTDLSPEIKEEFLGARMSDNRMLSNDPAIRRWMTNLARRILPSPTLVPSNAGDMGKTIDARLAEIKGKMGTPEYTKDEAMQAEYRDLLEAKDKQRKAA